MGIAREELEDSVAIILDGVVDIACATELKTALVDALRPGRPVRISLDLCAGFDVTAYQLLWAAEREANSLGVEFAITGPVPAHILAAMKEVGFEGFPVPA